jgi:hypothetical protein
MIKRHPQLNIKSKILFLDDIFIGLDISNRLPLLEILKKHFSDYQIFITTYDKPWYEFIKATYLTHNISWKSFEFYARRTKKGFEIPILKENKSNSFVQNYIDFAEYYFNEGDNKAAGVYLRSAFEFILKTFCFGNVPIQFQVDTSKIKTDTFWTAVKKYKDDNPVRCNLTLTTRNRIDYFTSLVLNPLSHHDINKHEISSEINGAISIIKTLKTELAV